MIPVYEPDLTDGDIQEVTAALRRGEISGTFGEAITTFEDEFSHYCGCKYGIAVTSGTTALHLAVEAAGIKPGDEVLMSASTNIATALAVAHHQAIPVPVDSESETWNLNLESIEPLISPKTKAIIPVHLFGHPVDMDHLNEIAEQYDLIVIEDAAEAHGATCRGKKTGSFGEMGCFSFYANKVITSGEGGMVVTDDPDIAENLRLLRNLAFTTPRFKHDVLGYNFRMTGYQAALGLSQFKRIETIIDKKRSVALKYLQELSNILGLQLPIEREWARNVFWVFGLLIHPESGITRDNLMAELYKKGIETRTFFCPMNQQPCLNKLGGFKEVDCRTADVLWERGLYLPSGPNLTDEQIFEITSSIRSFIK